MTDLITSLKKIIMNNHELAAASKWVLGSYILSQGLVLVQGLLSAYYLDPVELGIWGMTIIFYNLFQGFVQSGTSVDFIVLAPDDEVNEALQGSFWGHLSRNLVIALLFVAIRPLLVSIYKAPILDGIMLVYALAIIIDGFRNPGLGLEYRKMNLQSVVLVERITQAIGLVLGGILLIIFQNVWAVVIPISLSRLIYVGMSYRYNPLKVSLKNVPLKWIKKSFSFGSNLAFLALISLLVRQGPEFFIARTSGIDYYGKYSLLFLITSVPVNGVAYVVNKVSYPLYSKAMRAKMDLTKMVSSIQLLVFFIVALLLTFLIISSEAVIDILPGQIWDITLDSKLLEILAIYAIIRSVAATFGPIIKLKEKLQRNYNLIILVEVAVLCFAGLPVLLTRGVWGFVLVMCVGLLINILLSIGILKNHIRAIGLGKNLFLMAFFISGIILSKSIYRIYAFPSETLFNPLWVGFLYSGLVYVVLFMASSRLFKIDIRILLADIVRSNRDQVK